MTPFSTVAERMARGLSPAQFAMLCALDNGNADDAHMTINHGKGWRRTAHVLERRALIERRASWRITTYGKLVLNIVDADVAARQKAADNVTKKQ